MFMTKCIMRELENLEKDGVPWVKETLQACQKFVKFPCKHPGGVLSPDECIKNYVGNRNENKIFIASNDEDLRNYFRNEVGAVPLFFMKNNVLIMDSPSDVTNTKFQIKEQLKMEPTRSEKKFLKG
jgi:rRNA-processing protein FCF1